MPTISSAAVDADKVVMTGLDAFDSPVELSRVQLTELLDRARAFKWRRSGFPAPPAGPAPLAPADREVIALRHPVHVLADLITMSEGAGLALDQIAFCCTGDGSAALGESLMLAGVALGMDVRIAAPAKCWPADDAVARAHHLAAGTRAGLLITTNTVRALEGAHFLVTVPFGRHLTSTITETAALAYRPAAIRPLAEEQARNRLWVLEAVLAEWLSVPGSTWSKAAGA